MRWRCSTATRRTSAIPAHGATDRLFCGPPSLNFLKHILESYVAFFTALLGHLGIWGVLVIGTVDAIVPVVPLDWVLSAYVYKDPHRFWLYCLMGAVGSAVGSLVPYYIGRAGGELFLLKRINRKRLEELRDRHEKGEFLSVMVPTLLPPGTPMKLIILAAGAFEMRVPLFLAAMFVGRLLRFGLLSLLVIQFGPEIVRMAALAAGKYMTAALAIAVLLLALYLWRRRGRLREEIKSLEKP